MCSTTDNNVLYSYFCLKKGKLKWSGTLEDLKAFVLTEISEEIAECTTWRSPSGGTWQFNSEMLSVTWHSKSENIYFKGENGDDLTNRIHSYVNQTLGEDDQTGMNICPTNKLSKSIQSLLTIEDGDMNNNDRTKHTSIKEGVSEDEHASDTEKNEDLTTGGGNLEEVLHRLSQFSNNIIHETKSPEDRRNEHKLVNKCKFA